jgi:toxin CcdB
MARFDAYPGAGPVKYLLDVQSDHLAALGTRTVIPLIAPGSPLPPFRDLTPILLVNGEACIMMTPQVAALPRRRLGHPQGNLRDQSDDILRALDILLNGF